MIATLLPAGNAQPQCTNCVNGVCYDDPPSATTDNKLYAGRPTGGWNSNDNGTVSFNVITPHARKVILHTCGGKKFVVYQVVYCTVQPADIPGTALRTVPQSAPEVSTAPAVNGPSTGTWPPPPNPPFLTYMATNCHALSTGLGASTSAPTPNIPPPQAPQPASGGYTQGPSTSGGFRVEDDGASAVFRDPCWHRCIENCDPPPTGAVVIWYAAPLGPNGQPDHSKGIALHSATRRQDGEYDSKNGSELNNGPSSKSELDGKYGQAGETKKGTRIYQVTMIRDC